MAKKKMDLRETNVMTVNNGFITAKYDGRMSINAMKLLRLTLTQCRMNDNEFFEYDVTVTDLAAMFRIDASNIYREMDKITTQMMKTLIHIRPDGSKKDFDKFTMFSECHYREKTGILTVQLSEKMKPYVLELKGNFTKIPIGNLVTMRSKYSMKLYELLSMELRNAPTYGSKKQLVYLDLATIRTATGTEEKLKQIKELRERLLNIAVNEINESDIGWNISYTDRKNGRTIIGFDFVIKSKNHKEPVTEREQAYFDRAEEFVKEIKKNKSISGRDEGHDLPGQLQLLPDGSIT